MFEQLTVVGIGLIGGSLALAAKSRGLVRHVVGVARSLRTRQAALSLGIAEEISDDPAEAVRHADLVYVAVPVGASEDVLAAIARTVRPDALVTDAGSTKATTVAAARRHLLGRCTFIGGHPMAGAESSGPTAARANLFQGKVYFLTPTEDTPPDRLAQLTAFVEGLGARVVIVGPDRHDRFLAATSHLPHLIAAALCAAVAEACRDPADFALFVGDGLRDTTRIAKGPAEVWRDILLDNRGNIAAALALFNEKLMEFVQAMRHADGLELEALLEQARAFREGLDHP